VLQDKRKLRMPRMPSILILQEQDNKVLSSFPWVGRVIQVVECLVSKYEALSSNPSTIKKKKKKNTFPSKTAFPLEYYLLN
jgi:hypothetical protein